MAKKKKEATVEWSEVQTGTPTMVMFPAKNFNFRVSKTEFTINIPRKGNYNELAPEVFNKEDGDFMVFDPENQILYMPAITKILFAVSKYPELQSNQLFAPIALLLNEDSVDIIGQVVEMLPADITTSTAV